MRGDRCGTKWPLHYFQSKRERMKYHINPDHPESKILLQNNYSRFFTITKAMYYSKYANFEIIYLENYQRFLH